MKEMLYAVRCLKSNEVDPILITNEVDLILITNKNPFMRRLGIYPPLFTFQPYLYIQP